MDWFSIFAKFAYNESQNKHSFYRFSNCLDKFWGTFGNQMQNWTEVHN